MNTGDPAKNRGVGDVVATSLRIYRENANTLILLSALFLVPAALVTAIILAAAMPDTLKEYRPGSTTNPFEGIDPDEIRNFVLAVLGTMIISFIMGMLAIAGCFKAVVAALDGGTSDWRSSLGAARKNLRPLTAVLLIQTVLFLTYAIAALMVGAFSALLDGTVSVVVLLVAGAVGVYVFVSWSLSIPVVIEEGERGLRALARSHDLVRGRWWPTFLAYLIGFLALMVLSIVTDAIFGGDPAPEGQDLVIATLGSVITQILVNPFHASLIGVVYRDLKARKAEPSPDSATASEPTT